MSGPAFLDVPKPAAIAALPTIGQGMPVPWVTAYATKDTPSEMVVASANGPLAVCRCRLGEGRPLLGTQCVHRQRLAMRKRLCGACGNPLQPGATMLFMALDAGIDWTDHSNIPVSIEAPVHPLCGLYSALTCPRLLREPDELGVAIATDYELTGQILTGLNPDRTPQFTLAPYGHDHRRLGILHSYAAILRPPTARVITLADWLANHAPSRDALVTAGTA